MKTKTALGYIFTCVALLSVCYGSMQRVQAGQLFLFQLPFDRSPTSGEIDDAKKSAAQYGLPALIFLAVLTMLCASAVGNHVIGTCRLHFERIQQLFGHRQIICGLFITACIADAASTLWFFHKDGVDQELHPAIRLFAYAYGRTVGLLLGKGVQSLGILAVASAFPRLATGTLVLATGMYLVGAIYNIWCLWN